jgi:hypothetical protein
MGEVVAFPHPAVNLRFTNTRKWVAHCEFCDRTTRPAANKPSLVSLPEGWSMAPFPDDARHPDGSTGTLFQCAVCNRRSERGEGLYPRRE